MPTDTKQCRRCATCTNGCALARTEYPDTDQSQQISLSEGAEDWGEALSDAFAPPFEGAELPELLTAASADCGGSLFDWIACALGE